MSINPNVRGSENAENLPPSTKCGDDTFLLVAGSSKVANPDTIADNRLPATSVSQALELAPTYLTYEGSVTSNMLVLVKADRQTSLEDDSRSTNDLAEDLNGLHLTPVQTIPPSEGFESDSELVEYRMNKPFRK